MTRLTKEEMSKIRVSKCDTEKLIEELKKQSEKEFRECVFITKELYLYGTKTM